jgi:cell shape-determining protein MreC
MNELEQLRKEINELRERLALLERRESRIADAAHQEYQRQRLDWFQRQVPQPTFIQDVARHFPPGAVLC